MSETQITLKELIRYFEGDAANSLVKKIDRQRAEDAGFAEELEEWEARIMDENEPGETLRMMKMMEQTWQETEAHRMEEKKIILPRWMPLALAASIALIIASLFIFNPPESEILDQEQLATEVDQKIALMIGPKAGISSEQKDQLRQRTWTAIENEELDKALARVDSMIQADPQNSDYLLLKGLIYEKFGKRDKALEAMKSSLSLPATKSISRCESLWYLSLIYAHEGKKDEFTKFSEKWKENGCNRLDSGRAEQLNRIDQSLS